MIEVGHYTATHTKCVFRLRKGVYRVHPDALQAHIQRYGIQPVKSPGAGSCDEVKEPEMLYRASV